MQSNMHTFKSTDQKKLRVKKIPWCSDALTTMRKRTNALRRLYQRTKNNNDLRESSRDQYTTAKTAYQAAIKKGKNNILGEKICTATSPTNPWNGIYKIASEKHDRRQI